MTLLEAHMQLKEKATWLYHLEDDHIEAGDGRKITVNEDGGLVLITADGNEHTGPDAAWAHGLVVGLIAEEHARW